MMKLNVKGNVDFEKGMNDWKFNVLTKYIDLNTEKKDAVCGLLCQGTDIFKADIVKVVNQEIWKKAFGKKVEVTDIVLQHSGTELFLEVTANNMDKMEGAFIKLVNAKLINRKVLDTVSSILKKKRIPVDVKEITCFQEK